MRLFTALELDDETREQLIGICHGLPGARWTPPDRLHLTLRFFGELDPAPAEELQDALGDIQTPAFRFRLKGVGQFLREKVSEILWAGVETNPDLQNLQREIEQTARRLGLPSEKRRFEPHITIARLKNPTPARLEEYINEFSNFESDWIIADEFLLLSSVLKPEGAVHRVEEVYSLPER